MLHREKQNTFNFTKGYICKKYIKLTETRSQVVYSRIHLDIITLICIKNWKEIDNIHILVIDESLEENDNLLERLTYDEIMNSQLVYNVTTFNKEMLEFQHLINKDSNDFVTLTNLGKSIVPALISGSNKGIYLYIDSRDDTLERNIQITFSRITNKELYKNICDFVHFGNIKQILIEEKEITENHFSVSLSEENVTTILVSVPKNLDINLQIAAIIFYTDKITGFTTALRFCLRKIEDINMLSNYQMSTCDLYCMDLNDGPLKYMKGLYDISKIEINEDSILTFYSERTVNYVSKIYYLTSGDFIYNNITNTPLIIENRYLNMTRTTSRLELMSETSMSNSIARFLTESLPDIRTRSNIGSALEILMFSRNNFTTSDSDISTIPDLIYPDMPDSEPENSVQTVEDDIYGHTIDLKRYLSLYLTTLRSIIEEKELCEAEPCYDDVTCMISTEPIEINCTFYKCSKCNQCVEKTSLLFWLYKSKKDTCPNCRQIIYKLPKLYKRLEHPIDETNK